MASNAEANSVFCNKDTSGKENAVLEHRNHNLQDNLTTFSSNNGVACAIEILALNNDYEGVSELLFTIDSLEDRDVFESFVFAAIRLRSVDILQIAIEMRGRLQCATKDKPIIIQMINSNADWMFQTIANQCQSNELYDTELSKLAESKGAFFIAIYFGNNKKLKSTFEIIQDDNLLGFENILSNGTVIDFNNIVYLSAFSEKLTFLEHLKSVLKDNNNIQLVESIKKELNSEILNQYINLKGGNYKIVKVLLEMGANVNLGLPILTIVEQQNLDLLNLLLFYQPNLDFYIPFGQKNHFMQYILENNSQMAGEVLSKYKIIPGNNINPQIIVYAELLSRNSVIYKRNYYNEMIEFNLKHNNTLPKDDWAEFFFYMCKHTDINKELLMTFIKHDIPLNGTDEQGTNCLMYLAELAPHFSSIPKTSKKFNMLVPLYSEYLNELDNNGRNIMFYAYPAFNNENDLLLPGKYEYERLYRNSESFRELLSELGVSEVKDNFGNTAHQHYLKVIKPKLLSRWKKDKEFADQELNKYIDNSKQIAKQNKSNDRSSVWGDLFKGVAVALSTVAIGLDENTSVESRARTMAKLWDDTYNDGQGNFENNYYTNTMESVNNQVNTAAADLNRLDAETARINENIRLERERQLKALKEQQALASQIQKEKQNQSRQEDTKRNQQEYAAQKEYTAAHQQRLRDMAAKNSQNQRTNNSNRTSIVDAPAAAIPGSKPVKNIPMKRWREAMAYCETWTNKTDGRQRWLCSGPQQKALVSGDSLANELDVVGCERANANFNGISIRPKSDSKRRNLDNFSAKLFNCGKPLKTNSRDVVTKYRIDRAQFSQETYLCPEKYLDVPANVRDFFVKGDECVCSISTGSTVAANYSSMACLEHIDNNLINSPYGVAQW